MDVYIHEVNFPPLRLHLLATGCRGSRRVMSSTGWTSIKSTLITLEPPMTKVVFASN